MAHIKRLLSARVPGWLACAALCAAPSAALAADINSVTGPLPGEVPVAAQCALPAPTAGRGFAPAAAAAARPQNVANAQGSRVTVDGSAKVTQAWTTCKGVLPRGVSASIEVTLPGLPGAQGNQGTSVRWGAGASSQPAAPAP